jgi:hypothetical protein
MLTRDELFELFEAGVARGHDKATSKDWGHKGPYTEEEEFAKTLRYILIDRIPYKDVARREEIWYMTDEQVIAAIVGDE